MTHQADDEISTIYASLLKGREEERPRVAM